MSMDSSLKCKCTILTTLVTSMTISKNNSNRSKRRNFKFSKTMLHVKRGHGINPQCTFLVPSPHHIAPFCKMLTSWMKQYDNNYHSLLPIYLTLLLRHIQILTLKEGSLFST